MDQEFPWYRVVVVSGLLFVLLSLTSFLPLPVSIRVVREVLMILLYGVMMVAVWKSNRQQANQRREELDRLMGLIEHSMEAQHQQERDQIIEAHLPNLYESIVRSRARRNTPSIEPLNPQNSIGDMDCRFSANSSLFRCAVNPSGPCEGCPHREPKR